MKDISGKAGTIHPKTLTRRTVVQRLGLAGGGLWALGSSGLLQPTTALAALQPAFVSGQVWIEFDGAITAISAFEGGNAVVEVVSEALGLDMPIAKRPGGVRYEDIVLKVPFDVATTLTSWIQASIAKGPSARSGAIVFSDVNRVEWKRLEFANAIITEVALPICDNSLLKTVAQMTIRLIPESTSWTGGSGKILQLPVAKARIIGGFRLNIKGMEAATQYVNKIEGLSVRRAIQSDPVGQFKSKMLQVGAANVQPIKIALPEFRAAPFYKWFDSFILRGGAAAGEAELPGLVEWLSNDLSTVVASAQLMNLGIVRYAPDPYAAGLVNDRPPLVQVELYCEHLSFSLPG